MADLISLEEISAQIESTDYSNPANVEELRRLLERADAAYAVSISTTNLLTFAKNMKKKYAIRRLLRSRAPIREPTAGLTKSRAIRKSANFWKQR